MSGTGVGREAVGLAYREAGRLLAAFVTPEGDGSVEGHAFVLMAGYLARERVLVGPAGADVEQRLEALLDGGFEEVARDPRLFLRIHARAEEFVRDDWRRIERLARTIVARDGRFTAVDLAEFLRERAPQ